VGVGVDGYDDDHVHGDEDAHAHDYAHAQAHDYAHAQAHDYAHAYDHDHDHDHDYVDAVAPAVCGVFPTGGQAGPTIQHGRTYCRVIWINRNRGSCRSVSSCC
jgi:hypothetical protein